MSAQPIHRTAPPEPTPLEPLCVAVWNADPTVPSAARMLGLGRTSMFAAIRRGDIPVVRVGGRVLVPVESLRARLRAEVEVQRRGRGPEGAA